jgi:hypothetical protein
MTRKESVIMQALRRRLLIAVAVVLGAAPAVLSSSAAHAFVENWGG